MRLTKQQLYKTSAWYSKDFSNTVGMRLALSFLQRKRLRGSWYSFKIDFLDCVSSFSFYDFIVQADNELETQEIP